MKWKILLLLVCLCALCITASAEGAELRIHDPDLAAVEELLAGDDPVDTLYFSGLLSNPGRLVPLMEKYPDITFLWGNTVLDPDADEIDLSSQQLESIREVEALLPCFPRLKKVIMSDCGFGSEEMDALNSRYDDIRFVWTVKLGSMELRTDAECFAPCIERKRVSTRDLEELKYCTDLICVDLGHMNITDCEWTAYMPHLKYLILADTLVTDISPLAGHEELVFLELFLAPIHDAAPLVSCTALEDLNLCYVDIYSPEVLAEMTWLKRLWWDGPNWYPGQVLNGKLPDTQIEWHSGSSTGAGWRTGQRYYEMRDIMGMPYLIG